MKKVAIVAVCAAIAVVAAALKFSPRVADVQKETAAEQASQDRVVDDSIDAPVMVTVTATKSQLNSLTPVLAQRREVQVSNTPPAQAPQTYIGPDGKEHAIVYNQGLNLDSRGVQQMKAEIIMDMRAHPEVFVGLHGLEKSDVDDILAGKKDLPKEMLANLVM